MKVLLPDSTPLDLDLPGAVVYAVDQPIPDEHLDAEALVVWGNPGWQLRDAASRLTGLRWVQTLAAGPDAVLAAGFGPDVVITSGAGLHDRTVAEHTLALVLAAARRLNLLVRAQIGHRWAAELGGLQPVHDTGKFRTLRDAHVVVWGFGGIAATLAPLLASLGARVTGVAQSAGTRHGFPVVTTADLPSLLPTADVLINILPAVESTRRIVGAEVLALLPAHAWLVNVGRGSTVDEAALLEALRSGRLAGAALDVFETEPLPAGSGLWDEPNALITPHAAGGRPLGAADRIRSNYEALRAGRPLSHVVQASRHVVTAVRDIAAGAAEIFEWIADPARQPSFDGNDNLAEAVTGQRVRAVGDVFRTVLTSGGVRENHVVEFDEGRRIAWRPSEPGQAPPGHLWRWILEPIDDSTTRVTHVYDWTRLRDEKRLARARATTPERLRASLDRLAAKVTGGA